MVTEVGEITILFVPATAGVATELGALVPVPSVLSFLTRQRTPSRFLAALEIVLSSAAPEKTVAENTPIVPLFDERVASGYETVVLADTSIVSSSQTSVLLTESFV